MPHVLRSGFLEDNYQSATTGFCSRATVWRHAHRLRLAARACPARASGGAMDVESGDHAVRGRDIPRADSARTAPISELEDRFPAPGAASGGARPLNGLDARDG